MQPGHQKVGSAVLVVCGDSAAEMKAVPIVASSALIFADRLLREPFVPNQRSVGCIRLRPVQAARTVDSNYAHHHS